MFVIVSVVSCLYFSVSVVCVISLSACRVSCHLSHLYCLLLSGRAIDCNIVYYYYYVHVHDCYFCVFALLSIFIIRDVPHVSIAHFCPHNIQAQYIYIIPTCCKIAFMTYSLKRLAKGQVAFNSLSDSEANLLVRAKGGALSDLTRCTYARN